MSAAENELTPQHVSGKWALFEEIAGRTLMLCWLVYIIPIQAFHLVAQISNFDPSWQDVAALFRTSVLLIFSLISAALTVARRPAKAVAAGIEPRVTAVLGSYLLLLIPLFPATDVGPLWSQAAVWIMAIGICFCIYSLVWLGRSYSVMASARKLVTSGPYAVVRHPLYMCELIMLLGVTIAGFSIWSVLIALATVALLYRRMINEERILTAAFPEYAAYAQRVPRVLPRLLPLKGSVVGA